MEKDEHNTSDIPCDAMCIPSTSEENDDCRITCTDPQSLREILNVTFEQFSNFSNTVDSNDTSSKVFSIFSNSFKSSLQENILINGLPFVPDTNNKLSLPQKEENKQMIENELLSELSKTAVKVARKRKTYPTHCCKILKIEQKHDLQNLKKTKLINLPVSSSSPPSIASSRKSRHLKEKLTEFCSDMNNIQEIVQYRLKQREKVAMKLSLISKYKKSNLT